MRIMQPRWMVLAAISVFVALSPQPTAEGTGTTDAAQNGTQPASSSHVDDPQGLDNLQTLLKGLRHRVLRHSQLLEPRVPVETPPTEYLPYPPPPNYVWPPGPHTQYPPPSETNAPAGFYGGTGTGGQGNSGAGSAAGPVSQSSSATSSLRIPGLLRLPAHVLIAFLPSSMSLPPPPPPPPPSSSLSPLSKGRQAGSQILKERAPVETPPTEYLPYPPPPNYQWPAGSTPQNENPQPSESDPPPGWYTGQNPTGQGGSGAANQGGNPNQYPQASLGGSGGSGGGDGIGKAHLAWILIVTIIATGLVSGGVGYWQGKKKGAIAVAGIGNGGNPDPEKGVGLMAKMKLLQGWAKKKKGSKPSGAPAPAPASASAATEEEE
ncbi:MAG: hypothetical protein Q9219_004266 [cf. Caloplaca sp. 3 TL-2023]